MDNKKSYKQIIKSTAVFGSTQAMQMLVLIIRTKIVAVILGPAGMGLQSIFQTTIITINQFTNLGVFQSAIREISQAHEKQDTILLKRKINIFCGLTIILAITGTLIFASLSPIISKISFGNYKYTSSFLFLSISILFLTLSTGITTIFQGTREIRKLTKSSLISSVSNLLICLPIFYLWGINGIIPALVIGYFTTFLINIFTLNNFKITGQIPLRSIWQESIPMIKLGVILMLSNLLMNLFTFLTNSYISINGNIEDVGLYQSACSITNRNILVIISVLASDYYPRLAGSCNDSSLMKQIINQQVELISLIIAPLSICLIVFSEQIVHILLSNSFYVIIPMLKWMGVALLFRGIWMSMSYVILAKGDKKNYFIYDALVGNGLYFLSNITFYLYWGLNGLGISFLISSILIAILLLTIVYRKYNIRFTLSFIINFGIQLSLCILVLFISNQNMNKGTYYTLCFPILIISIYHAMYTIIKRTGFKINIK
ncbi:MAG: oligosaccharide flippase family protein [Macellibacteroides fermentans]|uniref:oligosaccharide flippase family protein n=1 Tax=Macellibacteroides fermentans TaxID=879969 RepID=UPI003AD13036